MRKWSFAAGLLSAMPLLGNSDGTPVGRTGAQADGGLSCSACHGSNSTNGRVVVEVSGYTPTVRQSIRVRVENPGAQRWGFQLTARPENDTSKVAGTFTPSTDINV